MRISGTALSKLSICSQTEIYRKHYKYYCDQFQNLVYLDIRNNQLENLEANGLSRLTDVYLSGKFILQVIFWNLNSNVSFYFEISDEYVIFELETRKLLEMF